MICQRCGNDFGSGLNCQHCGIDRVEGLGSFNGFHPGTKDGDNLAPGRITPGGMSVLKADSMVCFRCNEIIPGEAEFCPFCGMPQYVTCPRCGLRYLAQYPNCYKCGTNREDYLRQKENEEKEREERRRKEEEALRIRREEEVRRRKEEEAKRKGVEEIEKKRAEVKRKKEEAKETLWFVDYIRNNKNELLEKQRKIEKSMNGFSGFTITLIISAIAAFASMAFLETEYYYLMFVVIIAGVIACIIAGTVCNNNHKQSVESFLLEKYEVANHKKVSHTHPETINQLLEAILTNNNKLLDAILTIRVRHFELLEEAQKALFERVFVYIQNLVVNLQHRDSDFSVRDINYKLSCLECEISSNIINDQQVSRVVDFVLKDRDYWEKPDCLKSMNLGDEVLKIINSVNV